MHSGGPAIMKSCDEPLMHICTSFLSSHAPEGFSLLKACPTGSIKDPTNRIYCQLNDYCVTSDEDAPRWTPVHACGNCKHLAACTSVRREVDTISLKLTGSQHEARIFIFGVFLSDVFLQYTQPILGAAMTHFSNGNH